MSSPNGVQEPLFLHRVGEAGKVGRNHYMQFPLAPSDASDSLARFTGLDCAVAPSFPGGALAVAYFANGGCGRRQRTLLSTSCVNPLVPQVRIPAGTWGRGGLYGSTHCALMARGTMEQHAAAARPADEKALAALGAKRTSSAMSRKQH